MALVMKSWEAHCAHQHLPRSLAYRLVNAGFRVNGAAVHPILNLQYDEDSYSNWHGVFAISLRPGTTFQLMI
jgi:hypothetical protein